MIYIPLRFYFVMFLLQNSWLVPQSLVPRFTAWAIVVGAKTMMHVINKANKKGNKL